jgi:exopolysaccharide biosynthesis protein
MRWIGAEDALNMDGGGSTTLYVEGENGNGIVNHPSDNKKFDRQGERHVVNSLLFIR